jgi:predicted DNA-binding transcriptional regulator YafY
MRNGRISLLMAFTPVSLRTIRRDIERLRDLGYPVQATMGAVVDPEDLTVLAAAVANHERLRLEYRARDGTSGRRVVEPHRLVPAGRRWYLVAYDNDRDDWRIFRVDRIHEPQPTGVRVPPRELPAPDAAAFVRSKLYSLAPTYNAVATLQLSAEDVRARIGNVAGDLEPIDDHTCRLRSHTDTLEWLAFRLIMLGCEFEVHSPPELAAYLRSLAGRVTRAVDHVG